MKIKNIALFIVASLAVIFGDTTSEAQSRKEENSPILVVYFSMPETTKTENMTREEDNSVVVIDGKVLGNTQYVAKVIEEYTGGDIYRIEPENPYSVDHRTLVDLAADEQRKNVRPKLKTAVTNLEQYDTIFVGYPNWWGDMPMILYTFFDNHDLSGKRIIPFNTHGGSGFSDTINTITKLEPKARVEKTGYSVSRNSVHKAKPVIISWLKQLGF
ncbi:MAG: flavodoxin [Desulfobacter postgatei]|uniref:flavodoxin n=1 Tax=Desulfobacter postgatei TaxID=2293 RepID=UPI0023F16919|nr:flavodoxin [Desulfobacter postgatei]MDD4274845.1 flavodoxin [Desulfobacter postgatei]